MIAGIHRSLHTLILLDVINGNWFYESSKYSTLQVLIDSQRKLSRQKLLFNSVENLTIVPVSYWLGDLVKRLSERLSKSY